MKLSAPSKMPRREKVTVKTSFYFCNTGEGLRFLICRLLSIKKDYSPKEHEMNRTKEKRRYPARNRRSLFGVVFALMMTSVFFLVACDNNAAATDLVEDTAAGSFSRAVITENTHRGEGRNFSRRNGERSFSREDFIRWAEERGYSQEDLSQRQIRREYRLAEGGKFRAGEHHHHRFGRDNKGEPRFERRSRPEKG